MPTDTIEGFPLTVQQKRSWSFLASSPASELRSEAEFLIEGQLDRPLFENAIRKVIERQEICRCVFKRVPGLPEPVQTLEERYSLQVEQNGRRLETAPIFDWQVESTSATQHRFKISFPAVSADYTSLHLFAHELAREYGVAPRQENEPEPLQYLDYGEWQADLHSSSEAPTAIHFWKSFEQLPTTLPLETADPGFAAASELRMLSPAAIADLTRFAAAASCDIGDVIAAAWSTFCWTLQEGSSEVCVGVYTSGRNFEELKNALGPYDRYLPVRLAPNEESTPSRIVQSFRSAATSAKRHQEFYTGVASDGKNHFLPFLFANQASAVRHPLLEGSLKLQLVQAESHSEPFKLKVVLEDLATGVIRLFFNSKRFSREYAAILASRFTIFAADFFARPETSVSELQNTCSEEIELALATFSRTGDAPPEAPTVLDLFDSQVKQHPQRPALICGGKLMTYAQLDARANQLAHRLQKLGISKGMPVALTAERSFEVIVGLLGIQKAGGAYVPVDPAYPKDRIAFVLQDCGASVLVAQPQLREKLPVFRGQTVSLTADNPELAAESTSEIACPVDPDTPAYIIYTSGSTGQPKGVQITHRNLAFSTAARFDYYKEPIANYLLLSSFAFDSSIAGIFWSLTQGATLTIPREGTQQDPGEILALIREFKVSHLLTLPSFYQAILEQASPQDVSSLSTVIVAGEACTPELVGRHYAKIRGAVLYNEYGPTEGTVWATVHRCEPKTDLQSVPIGRPVPNMSIFILNSSQQFAGVGQLGEIFIGGPAVASGYLNRKDLTAEKFVSNPLRGNSGVATSLPSTLYRTGDLGCFRADGLIEFRGRIDEQVKIRGYRIEIGEIENVLARYPNLREAVVLAREDTPGDKRLVAYVVSKDQVHLSIPELRLFAQEKLPQFMVPSHFVILRHLPLTPNGKIDRKALPAPEDLERNERHFIAPRSQDEEQLARIWSDVLKLEKVGLEENFFDLGGHSMLAIQVIARVRDSFKLELPMSAFFESPTIEGMAAAIGRCRQTKGTVAGGIRRVARVAATDELLARLNDTTAK